MKGRKSLGLNVNEDVDKYQLRRLSSISQIAAGIAHEVKNPLTSVRGFLQLLSEKYPDKHFEIAELELDNALSIITNFLSVTKPNLDHESPQEVHVAAEIESTLNLFLDRMYRVTVEKHFSDTEISVYGRKNQIKRAFFNLLKNAFESIPGQGSIRLTHRVQGNEVLVAISDTGVGMDDEMMSLLGTPFLTTKDDGTGMGLPQVYSTIYQHGGRIAVDSKKGQGTTFTVFIPINRQEGGNLNVINLEYEPNQSLFDFMERNEPIFRQRLLSERPELSRVIQEIKDVSGIDLVNNAVTLVNLTLTKRPHELMTFAKKEGELWAKHSLQISLKLEWLQTISRVTWDFLFNYFRLKQEEQSLEDFFQLERNVNMALDSFLNNFAIRYNEFKDEVLRNQREMMEDLSVPIIPLTKTVSILPLIGTIDTFRANTIQDKVFRKIEDLQIETLIVDLSGVSFLDTAVLSHLFRLFDGIDVMGCHTIVTGIRSEIASSLLRMGISLPRTVTKKGNLQQAINLINFSE